MFGFSDSLCSVFEDPSVRKITGKFSTISAKLNNKKSSKKHLHFSKTCHKIKSANNNIKTLNKKIVP